MIDYYPEICPFCGSSNINFITAERCTQEHKVVEEKVNEYVNRLISYPKLGLEHSAFCIRTNEKNIWIDCPSTFSRDLEPMDKILFTHYHFLGASNLYREYYTAFIWIHKNDSDNFLANRYPFDRKFRENFELLGINAFHIDGHTPGFTCYIFKNVLFICDYLILRGQRIILNPYSSPTLTLKGAKNLSNIIITREIDTVCGVNYIMEYEEWGDKLQQLIKQN
jgi:hypothetical protein